MIKDSSESSIVSYNNLFKLFKSSLIPLDIKRTKEVAQWCWIKRKKGAIRELWRISGVEYVGRWVREKSVEWVTMSVDGRARSFDSERWIYVDGCSIAAFLLVIRKTFDETRWKRMCKRCDLDSLSALTLR